MSPARDACWILTDGRAGNLRQARALSCALADGGTREFELAPAAPWRWFAPRQLPGARHAWGSGFAELLDRPPALAVGCGRQAALATRLLRARGSRVVQILDPRVDSSHWDAVVVPAHDRLRGNNVYTVLGSLNPIDDAWLAAAREQWPAAGQLPGPRVAVLLGGPVAAAPLDDGWWQQLRLHLQAWRSGLGGSLLLACSPRTPAWLSADAREAAADWPGLRWYGSKDGDNPYAGMLAWADVIVVSPDSVNMVSEACATRVPVCVPGIERCSGRQRAFLEALLARGRISPMASQPPTTSGEPLRELDALARQLRERLALAPGLSVTTLPARSP